MRHASQGIAWIILLTACTGIVRANDLRIDNVRRDGQARFEVFGLEMVYVPEGPFTLGDPGTTALNFGAFYRSGADGRPDGLVPITSEAALPVGPEPGALYYRSPQPEYQGDGQGPVPAAFPKGYQAFYATRVRKATAIVAAASTIRGGRSATSTPTAPSPTDASAAGRGRIRTAPTASAVPAPPGRDSGFKVSGSKFFLEKS